MAGRIAAQKRNASNARLITAWALSISCTESRFTRHDAFLQPKLSQTLIVRDMSSLARLLTIGLLLTALAAPPSGPALELGAERLGMRDAGLPWLQQPATEPLWRGADSPEAAEEQPGARALARLLRANVASSPLEYRLLSDAADGRLDQWTLIPAALVAGGVDTEAVLARYARRCQTWTAAARAAIDPQDAPRRRAAALLDWMHGQIMPRGYQIDATELTTVIDRGQFNCVSATVLFLSLAAETGLRSTAIELPTHAYCRVTAPDETFDVEPTCRRWFDVIDDPEARAAVERRIAGAHNAEWADARNISPAQLLAVIYYNRGVDLIRRGDDAGAIEVNLRALMLDPDSATARGNLWVAVNNCALGYCRDQRFADAADLIGLARQAVPEHAALRANELYVYQQWSASLSDQQRLNEALAVLEEGLARQPGNPVLLARQEEMQQQLKTGRILSTEY